MAVVAAMDWCLRPVVGNFLNGTDSNMTAASARIPRKASQGKGFYAWRGAITLEAQQYIDAANHPNFPPVTLEPGQLYEQVGAATSSPRPVL